MEQQNGNENLKDLEMAKKRDHKIMITDEVIKKVPRVQYKNIPESEYNTIQKLARIVLHNHPSLSDFSLSDVQFLL